VDVWPADFDGDGTMDVAIQGPTAHELSVLFTGKPAASIAKFEFLRRFAAGDFNGDGSMDLVAFEDEPGTFYSVIATYVNDGRGVFTRTTPVRTPLSMNPLAIADMNRDGRADLLVAGYDP
jgi:hypothetical protein